MGGIEVIYGDTDSLMIRMVDLNEQDQEINKIIELNKKAQALRK
jgi:hypothetical protein